VTGFKSVNKSITKKSIVIADHNEIFKNKYYKSVFDTIDKIDPKLVCSAATLLAKTLSAMGRNVTNIETDNETSKINANCTLVDELLDCLGRNTSCSLKRQFLPGLDESNAPEFPVHYSSVYFRGTYSPHQKFIHDWVFDRVNISHFHTINLTKCTSDSQCKQGESCIKSMCQISATYYHEATNLNVKFIPPELFAGYYEVINKTQNISIWTESDWGTGLYGGNTLRLFEVTDPSIDYIFLGVAMAECLITLVIAIIIYKFFNVKYKIL